MTINAPFHDSLSRLAQVGTSVGVQLMRITGLQEANRYTARAIEFDLNDQTQYAEEDTITVTNLGEPAGQTGQVPENTDAVAIDVEGRWVVFLRPSVTVRFPAKVISSQGSGAYTVREQAVTPQGGFIDKPDTSNISSRNLAELSLGPGAAVDNGTIVMVIVLLDQASPPNVHYVFDHPAYAKYLD